MKEKTITSADVLKRMRAILQKGWTKGYYARGKSGRIVEPDSKAAVRYCLTGARLRATIDLKCEHVIENRVRRLIIECLPQRNVNVEAFNDALGTKKSDVMAVVNCAIQKAS